MPLKTKRCGSDLLKNLCKIAQTLLVFAIIARRFVCRWMNFINELTPQPSLQQLNRFEFIALLFMTSNHIEQTIRAIGIIIEKITNAFGALFLLTDGRFSPLHFGIFSFTM